MDGPAHTDMAATADGAATSQDVEFPEAVILVGSADWRCVSCGVSGSRDVSIDEHIYSKHSRHCSPSTSLLAADDDVIEKIRSSGQSDMRNIHIKESTGMPKKIGLREEKALICTGRRRGKKGGLWKCKKKRKLLLSKNDPSQAETETVDLTSGQNKDLLKSQKNKLNSHVLCENRISRKAIISDKFCEKSRGKRHRTLLACKDSAEPQSTVLGCADMDGSIQNDLCLQAGADKEVPKVLKFAMHENTRKETEITAAVSVEYCKSPDTNFVQPADVIDSVQESSKNNNEAGCFEQSSLLPTPVSSMLQDKIKEQMKKKYVVIQKAGYRNHPLDTVVETEVVFSLQTPSLQADELFSSAASNMPEVQGLTEMCTPVHPVSSELHTSNQYTTTSNQYTTTSNQYTTASNQYTTGLQQSSIVLCSLGIDTVNRLHEMESETFDVTDVVDTSFVCQTCGAAFESSEELRCHGDEMIKFDVVSCRQCGDNFHGLHQLNVHVFHTHEKLTPKFCFLCDTDCLDGFELEEHLLEHTTCEADGDDAYMKSMHHLCKTCGANVIGKWADLANHYYSSHNQLLCNKCFEIFHDYAQYNEHRLLHGTYESSAPVVYTCPVSDCFQMCPDKEALAHHISWHEDQDVDEEQLTIIPCPYCSAPFRNHISLQRHLTETHSEHGLKPFTCELCLEAFAHSLELHRHNQLQHAGIQRYGCAYCDQRFAFRSSHRRHVAAQHDVPATILHM